MKEIKKWPLGLFVLDLLGAIMAAIGVTGFIDDGGTDELLLIILGLCLMLPLILHILKLLPNAGSCEEKDKLDGEHSWNLKWPIGIG